MIARVSGRILEKGANYLLVDVSGIAYEILIAPAVMQRIEDNPEADQKVTLITYHYYQIEPSKSTPVLIGFLSEIEKEFFQTFITVSGIGPRAALKALSQPISLIARAIDEGDMNFLRSLPGIGQQRAREIIAKLQNKVGKFALIKDSPQPHHQEKAGIEEEAMAVLMQLEYKKAEAANMIKKALERDPQIETTEGLLNAVYKQRKA